MHKNCIPGEVLRGKIMATKALVKKQAKEIKQVESELLAMTGGSLEEAPEALPEHLEQIAQSLREFYICIENALGVIGHNLDESIPKEEDVHHRLLDLMGAPLQGVRPAVLDRVLRDDLEPYLQFRLDLEKDSSTGQDQERINMLLKNLKAVSAAARQQLTDFFVDVNKYHGFE